MTKNNPKYKIIFWGTPEFGTPSLISLINHSNYEIVAIVSQPDKKVGRKQKIEFSAIKKIALENNIKIFQPEKLSATFLNNLKKLSSDLNIVAAYGKIIPKQFLDLPKYKSINLHGSLLPKYRGASPIQSAILNQETKTGITAMLMDEKMDHGDIIAQEKIKICIDENAQTLHDKLSKLSAKLLIKILPNYLSKKIKLKQQNHKLATYTKILKREHGQVDWNQSNYKINAQIRAFYPWPGSFTYLNGKRLKIIKSSVSEHNFNLKKPGIIYLTKKNELAIQCSQNSLILEQVQLEGKKIITGANFLKGQKKIIGLQLKFI